jgi:cysteine-rich repeat protein
VGDVCDNCPEVANADQADGNDNGIGNACEAPGCGNGVLEEGEACDDGNWKPGDGCNAKCEIEKVPEPGALVITELLPNPSQANDVGEWIELYNPGTVEVDLAGMAIRTNAKIHVIEPVESVLVPAGGYAVISSIDLARMVEAHQRSRALATLAVQQRESSRYLLFERVAGGGCIFIWRTNACRPCSAPSR